MAWYVASFESAPRKKSLSSLESPALAGACILWRSSVRSTWSGASIPCDPWSGVRVTHMQPGCVVVLADLPLWLVNDPKPGPTSSSKYSSSSPSEDDDDEQSSPAGFSLF